VSRGKARNGRRQMSKKLYVGNLHWEVTEEDLIKTFGEIGECVSTNVVKDRYSGMSKGFGFVEMATDEEAGEAITKLNDLELHGRKILVQEARPRREGKNTPSGRQGFRR
jgi:RNA recognition motif-containing protein